MTFYYSMSNPYPQILNLNGTGLNDGDVYIGMPGQDPQDFPKDVYWDYAHTDLSAQPLETSGGYIVREGTPATVYLDGRYSIRVLDRSGSEVYYQAVVNDPVFEIGELVAELATDAGAGLIGASHAELYSTSTLGNRFKQMVFVTDRVDPNITPASTTRTAAQNTVSIQAALEYAESIGADLVFSPGTWKLKQLFRTGTLPIAIKGWQATIEQYHDDVNSITVGGAGMYKVSAAFFMKRDCGPTEITGFTFATNDASFPALDPSFSSYFPSIGGQFCDDLYIHHNRFEGGKDRALFVQGTSKGLRFHSNELANNGFTLHVGFTGNVYFYDASSNTTDVYSPQAPSIFDNIFDGYSSAQSQICAHLTGCIDFSVVGNRFYNMSIGAAGALTVLQFYANDFGPHDENGTPLSEIVGTCFDNIIRGTFTIGLKLDGYGPGLQPAAWTANYRWTVLIDKVDIRGTGRGFHIERARGWTMRNATVITSDHPFIYQREQHDYLVDGFYLENTGAPTSSIAISFNHFAGSTNGAWENGKFVSSASAQYTIRGDNTFAGLKMKNVTIVHGASVAGARMVLLTLNGPDNVFEDIRYDIRTTVASAFLWVLNGSAQTADLLFRGHQMVGSSGSGATTFRYCSLEGFRTVAIESPNRLDGAVLVEDVLETRISGRFAAASASASSAIKCDNTGLAQPAVVYLSDVNASQGALNLPCVDVVSNNDAANNTRTIAKGIIASGNSTGVLVRQQTQGTFNYLGVFITNAGAGGTTIGVTGSVVATNMGV
ncbi:hypothetical protein [Sphingomonas sp. SRS2]|uniref:hypothetical protein n=1 Tax=Sphingomonas sp. SRS2 TaxID=133190 RepID=UPI0006184B8B|nr:hypothetical protein [Sphingomonas sp. SRS2]KKC27332.1 hypothetical protein WP12_04085 [Sphingomonas sp. SRS2]